MTDDVYRVEESANSVIITLYISRKQWDIMCSWWLNERMKEFPIDNVSSGTEWDSPCEIGDKSDQESDIFQAAEDRQFIQQTKQRMPHFLESNWVSCDERDPRALAAGSGLSSSHYNLWDVSNEAPICDVGRVVLTELASNSPMRSSPSSLSATSEWPWSL